MSAPVTFEQVQDFLCEQWTVRPQRVTPSTRLLHDLGIDGDAAEKILLDFIERFHVDFTSFHFSDYFGSEAGAWRRWLIRKFRGGEALAFTPLTVQDLIDAANRGRWIQHEKHEV